MCVNKRGLSGVGVVVVLVLMVLSFASILSVSKTFVEKGGEIAVDAACKASADLRAATALRLGYSARTPIGDAVWYQNLYATPLACSTKEVIFEAADWKGKKKYDILVKDILDLMILCWRQFNEGKHDIIFEDPDSIDTCFKCFNIKVESIPSQSSGKYKVQEVETCEGKPCIGRGTFDFFVKNNDFEIKKYVTDDGKRKRITEKVNYGKYLTNAYTYFDKIDEPGIYSIYYSDPTFYRAIDYLGDEIEDEFFRNGLYIVPKDDILRLDKLRGQTLGERKGVEKLKEFRCKTI